jgi:hypothetical protein
MKTLHLLWLLTLAPGGLFGQGQVNFATIAVGVNAPVTNTITGLRVPTGNTFLAQLYYGPAGITDPAQLASVTNAPVGFAVDGFVIAGTRLTDPMVVAGDQIGTFQVRIWEAALGSTWEQAYLNWLAEPPKVLGWSAPIQVKVAKVGDTAANLIGLSPVYLAPVPEPASLLLGLLGAALLFLRKTRIG